MALDRSFAHDVGIDVSKYVPGDPHPPGLCRTNFFRLRDPPSSVLCFGLSTLFVACLHYALWWASFPVFHASRYILDNVHRYDGDGSFLAGPTERTKGLLDIVQKLCKEESEKVRIYNINGSSDMSASVILCASMT